MVIFWKKSTKKVVEKKLNSLTTPRSSTQLRTSIWSWSILILAQAKTRLPSTRPEYNPSTKQKVKISLISKSQKVRELDSLREEVVENSESALFVPTFKNKQIRPLNYCPCCPCCGFQYDTFFLKKYSSRVALVAHDALVALVAVFRSRRYFWELTWVISIKCLNFRMEN